MAHLPWLLYKKCVVITSYSIHYTKLYDLNVEMAAPVKPITPAQARKAGIPADVVAHFAATRSGVKLTRDNGNRAREIFGGSK